MNRASISQRAAMARVIEERIQNHAQCASAMVSFAKNYAETFQEIAHCLSRGGTMYTCGCGGSAAEAQHAASEFTGRLHQDDKKMLSAVSLCSDSVAMTAIANDFGYDEVFSRQLSAICSGSHDDVLVAYTTSGESQSVLSAIETAIEFQMLVIVFTGLSGEVAIKSKFGKYSDLYVIAARSLSTARIQEMHTLLTHLMCESVKELIPWEE